MVDLRAGASCGARWEASCGVSCGLSIFGPWEAKSGQLGLWELGVGASGGFGSKVLKVWREYFLPGGLRGARGGQRLGRADYQQLSLEGFQLFWHWYET